MTSWARRAVLLSPAVLLLLALAAPPATAQTGLTGTVTGTASDTSGGVLPNANVTLTNEGSGIVRRTLTNTQGYFVIAAVPPGTYMLSVEFPGFTTWARRSVVLHPGDRLNFPDVTLGAGKLDETVSVVAEAPALAPTDSGEKSFTITSEQIQNIAVVGRSAAELIKILPGVLPLTNNNRPGFTGELVGLKLSTSYGEVATNSVQGAFSVAGSRPDSLDITVDGAPASDRIRQGNVMNPNIEMTEEFKVLLSNFSAEHSRGPVSVTTVSKSGGRDFHGTLYTSYRNYRLNSNDWINNKNGIARPKTRFIYPGFNLSGPLLVPGTGFNKNRDKLFFFVGYEYDFQELDYFRRGWTYFPEMLNGDFSRAALLTPGNDQVSTVPAGGFVVPDPAGLKLASLFPSPTVTDPIALATNGGHNYVGSPLRQQNMTQMLARVDYSINDTTKLALRYNRQREKMDQPITVYGENLESWLPWPTPLDGRNRSDSVSATLTRVFDPTLTMEANATLTQVEFKNDPQDYSRMSRGALGYPYRGFFEIDSIPSITTVSPWIGGREGPVMFQPGGGTQPAGGSDFYTASVAFTKVAGTHTIKVGGNFDYAQNEGYDPWTTNGEIQIGKIPGGSGGAEPWGNWSATDNVLADLLTGRVSGYNQDHSFQPKSVKGRNIEAFIQDSWKPKPSLTLEAGLRFSSLGQWEDRNGVGPAVWFPELYASDLASDPDFHLPGARWYGRDRNVPMSGIQRRTMYVSPRVGFAWDTTGKGRTVLRGGFGVFRYSEDAFRMTEMLEGPAGFYNLNITGDAASFADLELQAAQMAANSGNRPARPGDGWSGTFWDKDDDKMPVAYNWSLTAQQRLPGSMMFEASYVGNHLANLLNADPSLANINFAPGYTGDRPYTGYGNLSIVSHILYQNYHSGQFSLARQKGPFSFLLAYTFSKSLGFRGFGYGSGSASGQILDPDPARRQQQLRETAYGVLGYDRTHVFNASYNYNFPELKEKKKLVRLLLGGWQISGVSQFFTGQPLQGQSNTRPNWGMSGTNAAGTDFRPSNMYPGFPSNLDDSRLVLPYPVISCDPRKDVPEGYYFNTSCFGAPNPGQYGNAMTPAVRGPSFHNHDLSLFKNFRLGDVRKLQLKMSAFNFLNHALTYPTTDNFRLSFDNGVINSPAFGRIPKDETVIVDGKEYRTGANKFGRRIVQLSVKFFF